MPRTQASGSFGPASVIEPTRGQVLPDSRDIRSDPGRFKQRLGYVPEEPILYSYLTGLEYLQLPGRLRHLPRERVNRKANELLELFSPRAYRHAPISTYSRG